MIKNLMFDLGGVIMEICRMNAVDALRDLGMTDADEYLGEYEQRGDFLALERGEITPEEFRDRLRRHIGRTDISDEAIDAAFSRFLTGIPVRRLRELEALHRHYNIYMLSNTNAIMWNGEIMSEFRKDGHDMDYYFDAVVPSFAVHAYKPEAAIFEAAGRICGIRPEETLFFDDSQRNVDAARALGFNAVLVPEGAEFTSLYDLGTGSVSKKALK